MEQLLTAIVYVSVTINNFESKHETMLNDGFKPCATGFNLYGIPDMSMIKTPMIIQSFCKYDRIDPTKYRETWKCELDANTRDSICKASYEPIEPFDINEFDKLDKLDKIKQIINSN